MRNNIDFVRAIKKAAADAAEASQPSDFCFGKVTNVSPLRIMVEQKLILGPAQLVITRNVTDFNIMVTMNWSTENALSTHTHNVNGSTGSGGSGHTHSVNITSNPVNLTHDHDIVGRKEITIHNALCIGDEVILLKQKGGQKYLVLDRVVST